MADEEESLEREDIQGLVIKGYRMPHAAYLFYRFTDRDRARSWVQHMVDPVTTAVEWDDKPAWCTNIGLTYGGLEALGLPAHLLATFPDDFRQGMAARAASHLGDVGPDLPEHWEASPPFATKGVHAMVLVSAQSKGQLDDTVAVFDKDSGDHGLEPVGSQYAAALGSAHSSDREHFGFRDGISQPTMKGSGLEHGEHADRLAVAPGEFVLGYRDELGNRPMPSPPALGRNSTYGVYRKLQQHVGAFRDFIRSRDGGELLAAKLMGRWPSGAPVALAKDADDPALGGDRDRNNQFSYLDDPLGFGCPRGAHVRRARPRNDDASSRRRLLLRRGLTYGGELAEGSPDDGAERGLVGLFLMASIERQFEFVQRKWLNSGQFDGLSNEPDPITGPGGGDFTWQRPMGPRRFQGLPRFVTARGGDYFFLPSITAMSFLSDPSSF